ncbi:MAG TPA: hypothetical protein VMX74_01805 [Pirellulales bacterium]|nr:hypothetical protein [Pirellulales bacterium]
MAKPSQSRAKMEDAKRKEAAAIKAGTTTIKKDRMEYMPPKAAPKKNTVANDRSMMDKLTGKGATNVVDDLEGRKSGVASLLKKFGMGKKK